jgi:hypothetical protein
MSDANLRVGKFFYTKIDPPELITGSIFYKIVTNDEIVKCNCKDIRNAFVKKHPDIFLEYASFF